MLSSLLPTQPNYPWALTLTLMNTNQYQLLTTHFTALFDSAQEAPLSVLLYPAADSLHSLCDYFPLLQNSTLASAIRWSVPPLQSCVFIKHHNYFATRPEVGPYFPPGISLWNCWLFYSRISRAPLQIFCVVLPRLKQASFFFFFFTSEICFTISIHQLLHITLLCFFFFYPLQ